MRRELMDILACPVCKHELALDATEEDAVEVLAGTLRCGGCGEEYPIAGGIPNLLPPDVRRTIEREEAAASGAGS